MPAYGINDKGYTIGPNGYVNSIPVDTFERGNINPYRGSVGAWGTTGSPTTQGNYALESPYGEGNKSILSRPGDGLNYYPSRGDTIKFDLRIDDTWSKYYFMFGHGSGSIEEDSYEVVFDADGNDLILENDRGADYRLDRTYHDFDVNVYRECEIDWHPNGIDVSYDGSTLSTGNEARNSGGVGFFTGGGRCYFDNVRAV